MSENTGKNGKNPDSDEPKISFVEMLYRCNQALATVLDEELRLRVTAKDIEWLRRYANIRWEVAKP